MLNLFTRPPVRPAAATQLPQLLHARKPTAEARAACQRCARWGCEAAQPARHLAAIFALCTKQQALAAGMPNWQSPGLHRRPGPPAHVVVEQQRLKPVGALAPVDAHVQGQEGGHVLAATVGHEAWGGGGAGEVGVRVGVGARRTTTYTVVKLQHTAGTAWAHCFLLSPARQGPVKGAVTSEAPALTARPPLCRRHHAWRGHQAAKVCMHQAAGVGAHPWP